MEIDGDLTLRDAGSHYVGEAAGGRVPVLAWTKGVEFAANARTQIANLTKMPFVRAHVAVMPDVHWGKGSTVGSVVATKGAIVPAAVGVDIGCGMMALETPLRAGDLPNDLHSLREAIEARIPVGRTNNGGAGDRGAFATMSPRRLARWDAMAAAFAAILERSPGIAKRGGFEGAAHQARAHLGTLGTGNHFVEVCLDEARRVWIMLHSGSRGIGNRFATHFIATAQQQAQRFHYEAFLPDADLAYLCEGTEEYDAYIEAVMWAQNYALENRREMLALVVDAFAAIGLAFEPSTEPIACHHNYIARERHFGENVIVTRKGAVRAGDGDLGIIPGSMGARSYIVRGKGSRLSFESCSHGAGRRLARNEAKRSITMADFQAAMVGVESRTDEAVLDEAPQAYKDLDSVMRAQADLTEAIHTLKQVVVVKG